MTITELIAKLSEIREAEGDIDVVVRDYDGDPEAVDGDLIKVIDVIAHGVGDYRYYSRIYDYETRVGNAKVVQL